MIKKLILKDFRNHANLELVINQNVIIIEGVNGAGKTSILEAIYLLATTKSHRTNHDLELIRHNCEFSLAEIKTNDNHIKVVISELGKVLLVDDVHKKRFSDHLGLLKVVMFAPEDLQLIYGTPGDRRYFLDLELSQVDRSYLRLMTRYKNLLKQRNNLLKREINEKNQTALDVLSDELIELNLSIRAKRISFIQALQDYLNELTINTGILVKLEYKPQLDDKKLIKHLKNNQKHDLLHQSTMYGVHKDDLLIQINDYHSKSYASQGQVRFAVILMKLALVECLKQITLDPIVLLVDDVFGELDPIVQPKIFKLLSSGEQVIITSVTPLQIDTKDVQYLQIDATKKGNAI